MQSLVEQNRGVRCGLSKRLRREEVRDERGEHVALALHAGPDVLERPALETCAAWPDMFRISLRGASLLWARTWRDHDGWTWVPADRLAPRLLAPMRADVEPAAERPPEPSDEPSLEQLEANADEARRRGRHDEAASILERLVALDPRGRGEVALFTLGTIRGAQGRHTLAARYDARYRARFPDGALLEDALAAEAVHTAELDAARAALLAGQYLERYPDGTHRREVEVVLAQ